MLKQSTYSHWSLSQWVTVMGISLMLLTVTGCAETMDRLSKVGKEPPLSTIENPVEKQDYKPVSWPMPEKATPVRRNPNSLWQPGSRAFFRDQRANRVGDIVTVKIEINDRAQLDNLTERERESEEGLQVPALWGLERRVVGLLPGDADETNLFDLNQESTTTGQGIIQRRERIETEIAALVVQRLPNGNLVIHGQQEVRVNYEKRQVAVTGVIRPEDIKADNTIELSQLAEARVVYGGQGQLSDLQQPRYGTQIIDVLSPF